MKVSIILPTYNERGNIVRLVNCIMENIPSDWEYEAIVVDDNSPDGTYIAVCEAFKDNPLVIPLLRTTDRGFAKSIRAGIERASGDQVLIMDTDFTHDPLDIPKMLHISKVFDIVSGSRFCPGGNMESIKHYLASLFYNWLIRIILRTQIQDNLGGYFTAPKEKMMQLPYDKIFFGYGEYFFRLLHYAQKRGMSIIEIPSYYHTRQKGTSKSNFGKLLGSYTRALIRLKIDSKADDTKNKNRSWQR